MKEGRKGGGGREGGRDKGREERRREGGWEGGSWGVRLDLCLGTEIRTDLSQQSHQECRILQRTLLIQQRNQLKERESDVSG